MTKAEMNSARDAVNAVVTLVNAGFKVIPGKEWNASPRSVEFRMHEDSFLICATNGKRIAVHPAYMLADFVHGYLSCYCSACGGDKRYGKCQNWSICK